MKLKSVTALMFTAIVLAWTTPVLAAEFHPVTGEQLSENQTFTYWLLDEFPTLDPQLNEETAGFSVIRDLFEGLMSQDENGELVPGVATGLAASNGNKTYTFTLRQNAKWSNGDPVTAHDFVYSWRRAASPETASPYAWYVELSSIENAAEIIAGGMAPETLGVRAVDDFTLEVNLSQSLPYFPAMTTYATLFPTHQKTVETYGADWTKPENIVSNGAYVLTEHVPGEYHTRKKSPAYWDSDNVFFESVTGLVISDENIALTRYLAGELDRTGVPTGQFPSLKDKYPTEATSVPLLCTYYYWINHTASANPALKDVRVRTALSLALDRDVMVNAVLKGGQYPAYHFTHVATAGFEAPDIDYGRLSQEERDARAQSLMAEAGYAEDSPLELTLIYNTSEGHKRIATVVSQMWKQKLGVAITLANYEWKTYLGIVSSQEFDLARSGWCGDYNEASTFLDLLGSRHGNNDGKYTNSEVDDLLAEAKLMSDPNPNYTAVEKILAEDMAIIPVYHYASNFLLKDDIKGWPYNNVQGNWYSKNLYRIAK